MSTHNDNKLLNNTINRRLNLINILAKNSDWFFLNELANMLNVSERVLKNDLAYFRKEVDDFTIYSSRKGIKLAFKDNKGLNTISKKILISVVPFQVLEKIFLNETKSVNQLADELFISVSTLYRIIKDINFKLKKYDIRINTNPCMVIGNEKKIRYFAYQYFHERYSLLEWPFKDLDESIINNFMKIFIDFNDNSTYYISLTTLKSVVMINLIRHKHKHYINTNYIKQNFDDIHVLFDEDMDAFLNFENSTNHTIDDYFIKQIFYPYVQDSFFYDYSLLKKAAKLNKLYESEIVYLSKFLDGISKKFEIPLTIKNKNQIILILHNTLFLEDQEPRSGYIVYDEFGHFVETIEKEYPVFYKDLYEGISNYRKLMQVPYDEKRKHLLIYTTFIHWRKLIPCLRKKYKSIKTLIISDYNISHAHLLEDFLNQEFPNNLKTEIFSEDLLNQSLLENLPHEIIITNFPFPSLKDKELICIQNLPTNQDITKIQSAISRILTNRK